MFVNKVSCVSSNAVFKGYQHVKNNVGADVMKFNYPFNPEEEICEIQIFKVIPTDKFNYKVEEAKPIYTFSLSKDGTEVNLQEVTNLDKDEAFAYKVVRKNKEGKIIWQGADTGVKMRPGQNGDYVFRVNLDEPGLKGGEALLLDKDGKPKTDNNGKPETREIWYNGTTDFKDDAISNYNYTLVKQNGTKPTVQGTAYLAMPDSYMPGMKYRGFNEEGTGEVYYDEEHQKKMEGMVKTVSNMYGGSMAGLEALVPYLKENNFKLLFTTPIANGDDRASHGYWNKNNMQIASNMGNTENYNSLMVKEFQNGISHVFDATLSSEGLEGIHVQYNLRWGDQAQSFRWFRMDSLKNSALGFGVLPENTKNLRFRVVNAPYKYELNSGGKYVKVKNDDYKSNKETYFQIYDASQVTKEQESMLDKNIQVYQNLKSGKNLDINTHDDTVISYSFEINPKELDKRIDVVNDLNKSGKSIRLDSSEGTIITAQFSNFAFTKLTEGGYVAWDANTDMIKMNYGISPYDEKNLQAITNPAQRQHERDLRVRAAMEVQDMAVQTGIYWADKTKTAHTLYTAKTLGDAKTIEKINKLIDESKLPEEVRISSQRLDNILNGRYNLAPKGRLSKDDVTIKALMKLPLDSLEFGENTVGVLSTSYFSNRATTEDTIGLSRFELMKKNNPHLVEPYSKIYNKTNNIFSSELKNFADSVIKKVNEKSNTKLIESDGKYTEYGEYVIELIGQDIAKYALLKSLAGDNLKTKILSSGELTYNYADIKSATTLKALGINASNPTEEAAILQGKIIKGLKKLADKDIDEVAKSISERIKGTDTDSFRLAEAMVDLSGLGLNYRLDAAKDLADIDSVRNRESDFNDTWTGLIKFWSRYVQGVKSVNPQAYIVAEMTDVADVIRETYGGPDSCPYNGWTNVQNAVYNGEPDAMTKFFNETGITSEAAYAYFFTELLTNFSGEFETGGGANETHDGFKHKYDLLMNTRSVDYLRNLYTFMGNHDKTRTIHGLAVDMKLFHSSLYYRPTNKDSYKINRDQRLDAIRVLSGAKTEKDIPLELKLNLDNLDYFRTVSAKAVAQTKLLTGSVDEDLGDIASDEDRKLIRDALIDLANGNYMISKTSEKMTKINIKELSSIENAVNAVADIVRKNGGNISKADIDNIIDKAYKLDFKNYTIKGDFNWTSPKEFGEENIHDLEKIIGSAYNDPMEYSIYTVKIARMLQDAAKSTPQAGNVNIALKEFVKTYNRAKVAENSDKLKMSEDTVTTRRKNGYAFRDFRVALEEAINQAEYKSGKVISNKDEIINTVYKSVTEPAIQKHAMILSFLSALCGIPTLYSGDEIDETGYEEKTKNISLQNRNAAKWSEYMDKNSKMGAFLRATQKKTIDAMINKAKVNAIKNGTPYTMDVYIDKMNRDQMKAKIQELKIIRDNLPEGSELRKEYDKKIEETINKVAKVAFMVQNADGDAAISVFNAGGISHNNRENYFKKYNIEDKVKRNQFFEENNIDKVGIDNPYIPIQKRSEVDALLLGAGISLPIGTVFMNAAEKDNVQYVVDKIDGKLGIVRKDGKKIIMDGLTAKNGVMVLRRAFRGRQNMNNRVYDKRYNLVSNPYKHNAAVEKGKQLSLIAG